MFYETLIEQNPNSEMAQEWCLAYGILPFDKANKLNMIVCKRKGKPVASIASPPPKSSGKATSKPAAKAATSTASNKRKKVQDDDDVAGDTGMGASSSWEGIGASGL